MPVLHLYSLKNEFVPQSPIIHSTSYSTTCHLQLLAPNHWPCRAELSLLFKSTAMFHIIKDCKIGPQITELFPVSLQGYWNRFKRIKIRHVPISSLNIDLRKRFASRQLHLLYSPCIITHPPHQLPKTVLVIIKYILNTHNIIYP